MRSLTTTLPIRFGDALLRLRSHSLHQENEGMSAAQTRYFIVTHIRRSAAMTHEVTGRHPAQALRRCATTPKESLSASLPENEKMSASQTRYFIVTPIRKSAAMTNEVTDRHPAQALRRCATTPEDSLSASLPENEGMSAARTRFQLTFIFALSIGS